MARLCSLLVASILVVVSLLLPRVFGFSKYTIGGKQGWNPGVNYSNWNNDTTYYVGDWLVFYYQPGMANVIQVNESNYNSCIADDPISNYSKGRSYAFRLNHTGDYYFICSNGFCFGGMKLHIKAHNLPPPSPPPDQPSATELLRAKVARVLAVAATTGLAILRSI